MSYISVIFFYSLIILFVYIYRSKFDFQAKFIALYRTQFGLKYMNKIANATPRFWKVFGYSGVVVGYLGLIVISYVLVKGLFDLILLPQAPATISLVIPGVKIPGSPIFIPFWSGIISIFIVAFIHEFAHGIIARLYDIKVKSSGIVFFGPIIGAFVEPDEKQMEKKPRMQQLSVFAAGPFSNICLGFLIMFFLVAVLFPVAGALVHTTGIEITSVQDGFPALDSGLKAGEIITYVNGERIVDIVNFTDALSNQKPGEEVILGTDNKKAYTIKLAENPNNKTLGYMGVTLSQKSDIKEEVLAQYGSVSYGIFYLMDFLKILFMLTFGIGFANLLPLGPVDGGRILQVTLYRFFNKNKANMIWGKISLLTLLVLLFNIVFPVIRTFIF